MFEIFLNYAIYLLLMQTKYLFVYVVIYILLGKIIIRRNGGDVYNPIVIRY